MEKALVLAWNGIIDNKDYFLRKWEEQEKSENLLEVYRAKDFQELMQVGEKIEKMDTDYVQRTLNHIKVFVNGTLVIVFLDGTEIECKSS